MTVCVAGGFSSTDAQAGTFTVWSCHRPDGQAAPLDRWSSAITAPYIDNWSSCANGGAGAFGTSILAAPHPGHSHGYWRFAAPAGTSVVAFQYSRSVSVADWAAYNLFQGQTAIFDSAHLRETCWAAMGCASLPNNTLTFSNLPNVDGMLVLTEACGKDSSCDAASNGVSSISRAGVTLEDSDAPTFSGVSGSLVSGSPLSGNASLSVQAADVGSGLYRIRTAVDGMTIENRVIDDNGARCATVGPGRDFAYAVPCRLSWTTGTTIDTTRLAEGRHGLVVAIEDAAGNTTTVVNQTITVDNVALPSGGSPSIGGELYAGTTLTAKPGTWSNAQGGFSFAWMRCDAAGDGCEQIATGATYTLALLDVGRSIRLRTTAANSAGETTTATTQPTALITERAASATGSSGADGSAPPPSSSGAGGSGAANGQNAGPAATLRVSFPRGRQTFRTVWGARRVRITGRLLNSATGLPIAGAMVEQISRSSAAKAKDAPSRWLRTDGTGTFSMVVPRNAPGQTLTFQYRAQTGTTAPVVASARLALRVVAKVAWRATSSRRTLRFAGRLSRPVPRRPVQYVEVQWRRGTGWATLAHPVRVRANGSWSLRYPVGANVATGSRFQFRVAIRSTSPNYAYEATRTRARWVTVR